MGLPNRWIQYGEVLMSLFWNLNEGRQGNGWADCPLSWLDIKAWADLLHLNLRGVELHLLKAMDVSYINAGRVQA